MKRANLRAGDRRAARWSALLALAIAGFWLAAVPAHAHRIRIATFHVTVADTGVEIHAPLLPLEILPDSLPERSDWAHGESVPGAVAADLLRYFGERIELSEGRRRLPLDSLEASIAAPDTENLERLTREGILIADSAGAVFIEIRGRYIRSGSREPLQLDALHLFEKIEDAYPPLPVADIRGPGYHEIFPFDGFATWKEPVHGRSLRDLLLAFLGSGVWHIFTGYDHMLFLLGLHLSSPNLKETLKIVTAFTISHTITLFLAATGSVAVSSALVEPAIALTIVYVGVENIWKPSPAKRWMTAFFFGLIHGFGFAGALGESLSIGRLDRWAFGTAILSFNIGVEAGQAAVVASLAPFWVGVRWAPQRRKIVVIGSVLIALIGGFWFVQRVFLT